MTFQDIMYHCSYSAISHHERYQVKFKLEFSYYKHVIPQVESGWSAWLAQCVGSYQLSHELS